MSWFDIIKVYGQAGMTPEEQTAANKENEKLRARVKALGVKDNDPLLRGRLNPEVYQLIIEREEAKRRQPQQTQQPQPNANRTVARNVKLPDGPLTPQERAEQNKQRNLKNQTPLPVIDKPLTREEEAQRRQNKSGKNQIALPAKPQKPQETKTVPLPQKTQQQQQQQQQQLLEVMQQSVPLPPHTPRNKEPDIDIKQISRQLEQATVPLPKDKNLSPKVKQKLQRNEVKQVPLPKTPEKEELSPEVIQQLKRKVSPVVNPPVKTREKQLSMSLSDKARAKREAEIARLRGGIQQRQQKRQSNIRERPSRISSGGL